ncbi:Hypothetical predicted protein [Cloeon dipterum]|uniref:Uncharacterized protein n=1 Tax=Cloeon dipterum TaxID=197152 RepID=A0A8S1DMV9_9INSE|nr:Hypothetical predicted protein [Cloeon dipterum]
MKRSVSADRAPRPHELQPFNNVKPARPTLRASSVGCDVRCGCQFFGTDSLLPERRALMLAGRPLGMVPPSSASSSPSGSFRSPVPNRTGVLRREAFIAGRTRSSEAAAGDHEYEPVSPRRPPQVLVSGPYDRYEPELGMAPGREGSNDSNDRIRREKKFLHHDSFDDEMTYFRRAPLNQQNSEEDRIMAIDEHDPGIEREDAAPSPAGTASSRTDIELNTSQVDSSALEDLPLSREARRKQRLENEAEERGPGAAARSLQSIRNQAGRLRAKMRAMKRPKINLPDRPKFNMPERPKFKMPERPKFKMPERPKFNLPDRPKFNLPERPKFNFPDRPKFKMPERPNFNFPSISLPRPRRVLREKNGEEQSVHTDTPMVETPSKRNYFDFKTYPRLFDRKNKRRELNISAPMQVRPPRLPPVEFHYDDEEEDMDPIKPELPPRRRGSQDSSKNRWASKFSELEYMDEENYKELRKNGSVQPFDDEDEDEEIRQLQKELRKQHSNDSEQECSESLSGFRDRDFGYTLSLVNRQATPLNNQQRQQNVIVPLDDEEEISLPGSDQEVAHSSGSSSDRRRQGVLEEISSDEFFLREKGVSQDDVDVERYLSREIKETFRPTVDTEALLMENSTVNEADLARTYRGTPERISPSHKARPPRKTRSIKNSSNLSTPPASEVITKDKEEEEEEEEVEKKENKEDTSWYFNTFPPNKPTRERRRQLRHERHKASTMTRKAGPKAPQRKTKTRSEFTIGNTSEWSVAPDQEWLNNLESHIVPKEVEAQSNEPDYIIPDVETPSAPKRGRKQSKRPDEDARSYVSYVSKASDMTEEPGYAYVVKPGVISYEQTQATPPPRRAKQFPTALRRKKSRPLSGSGASHFFTMPHRKPMPVRPSRNYATLGPSRPPRRQRRASLEDVRSESLQSGAVIQKMKERPLPPPPRPPRKERGQDGDLDAMDAEFAAMSENAPLADDEDLDIIRSPEPQTAKKDVSPTQSEEHVISAHLTLENSEIVVIQEDVKSEKDDQTVPVEATREVAPETRDEVPSVPAEADTEIPSSTQIEQEVQERFIDPEEVIELPDKIEIIQESFPDVALPIEESISVLKVQEAFQESPAQIPQEKPAEIVVEPPVQEVVVEASEKYPEVSVEAIQEPSIAAEPSIVVSYEQEPQVESVVSPVEPVNPQVEEVIPQVESVTEEPVLVEDIVPSNQEISTQFEEPCVEEVTVSTQTDPLPEDVLIGEIVPVETEDVACGPSEVQEVQQQQQQQQQPIVEAPVVAAPVSSSSSQNELAPAVAALLEALRAGQLRLDLLDVGRLSVSELQAGRMLVSDIEGMNLNVADLHSNNGALVLSSVQAPMDALAEALLAAAQRMIPPPPPPPQIIHVPSPPPPHSDMQCQTQTPKSTPPRQPSQAIEEVVEAAEAQQLEVQEMSISRHSPSPVFTTEQVLALQAAALSSVARERSRDRSVPPPPPTADFGAPPPPFQQQQQQQQDVDPGIVELGNRLARACCCATLSALRRVVTYTEQQADSLADETRERSGLQMALCVVLVLVAGIILVASMGGDGDAVHHHHWDFYMPK